MFRKGRSKSNFKSSRRVIIQGGGRNNSKGRTQRGYRGNFEVYVQYTKLTSNDLMKLLKGIEDAKEYAILDYEDATNSNLQNDAREIRVETVETGRSVTLLFETSTLPELLEVGKTMIPAAGTYLTVGYLTIQGILKTYRTFIAARTETIEMHHKFYEMKIKQMDYEDRLEAKRVLNQEQLDRSELHRLSPEERRLERRQKHKTAKENGVIRFLSYIQSSTNITEVTINKISLKKNPPKEEKP